MTFAEKISAAAALTSERLKKGSKEDAVAFLKRAGILNASGNLHPKLAAKSSELKIHGTKRKKGRSI
ncbi:MAG: hypothetical protein O9296_17425 [Novosphingobium sp.]|nr:hypothetical protein [Novosphingobium sp.]